MLIRLAFFFLALLLSVVNPAKALDPEKRISQYAHTAWRIEDGVFSGAPHAITQTTDGYLWIGTEAGLMRFDGVRFFPWTAPDGKPLLSASIYSLLGARDGSLWIGAGIGLARRRNGQVFNYNEPLGRINSIVEDQAGAIWMTRSVRVIDAKGPLCRVAGNAVRCFGAADGIPFLTGGPLLGDTLGNFWIGSARGPCRWRPGSSCAYFPQELSQTGQAAVGAIAFGKDGSLWAGMEESGTGRGLQQLIQEVWKPYILPGIGSAALDISALLIDRDKALWIGTVSQGIYRIYDGKTDHFDTSDGLSSDSVGGFYQDKEGNLWVITSKGIDRFHNLRVASVSVRQGLSADHASSVLASRDGTVWIGNDGALDFLRHGKPSAIRAGKGLPGRNVTSLLEDHANRLWIGIDDGLTVYERGRFQPVTRPDGSPIGVVVAMTEDVDNNVWAEVALKQAPLIRIKDLRFREEIVSPRAFALAADPKGGIWLGSVNEGLLRYRRGRFEIIPPKVPEIRSLLVDPDGSLWAATRSGLVRWQEGKLKILNSANGLPCDSVAAVVKDNADSLWLYAKCGLITIANAELERWWKHPDTMVKLLAFDVFDGAQPTLMSFRPGASKSPDGRLWFVNDSILQLIDPGHPEGNAVPPAVHVEQITADHKAYWNNSLGNKSPALRLPPLVHDLEIDYTALSLMVPEKIRFRYKLEGRDSDWQDVGNRRQAFYSDLPPRDYRFRVMACNNSGVWNEAGASFDFSIPPVYYQTRWFWASCVAALMTLLWALYQLRLRQIAQEFSVRMEERVGERMRIARDLHDTLLQSFQGLMLRLQVVDELLPHGKAKEQLEQSLERADQAIAEGRSAIQNLRTTTTAGSDLAEALRAAAGEMLGDGAATFRLVAEGRTRDLNPILRDEVYRIACEGLRNAFSHARARHIETEIAYGERLFRIRIRDDGDGIPLEILKAGRSGHYGLGGMRERASQTGAKLDIWSSAGKGTEIDLSFPGSIAYGSPARRSRLRLFRKKVG